MGSQGSCWGGGVSALNGGEKEKEEETLSVAPPTGRNAALPPEPKV